MCITDISQHYYLQMRFVVFRIYNPVKCEMAMEKYYFEVFRQIVQNNAEPQTHLSVHFMHCNL